MATIKQKTIQTSTSNSSSVISTSPKATQLVSKTSDLVSFQSGSRISSDQLNANFDVLFNKTGNVVTAINEINEKLTTVEYAKQKINKESFVTVLDEVLPYVKLLTLERTLVENSETNQSFVMRLRLQGAGVNTASEDILNILINTSANYKDDVFLDPNQGVVTAITADITYNLRFFYTVDTSLLKQVYTFYAVPNLQSPLLPGIPSSYVISDILSYAGNYSYSEMQVTLNGNTNSDGLLEIDWQTEDKEKIEEANEIVTQTWDISDIQDEVNDFIAEVTNTLSIFDEYKANGLIKEDGTYVTDHSLETFEVLDDKISAKDIINPKIFTATDGESNKASDGIVKALNTNKTQQTQIDNKVNGIEGTVDLDETVFFVDPEVEKIQTNAPHIPFIPTSEAKTAKSGSKKTRSILATNVQDAVEEVGAVTELNLNKNEEQDIRLTNSENRLSSIEASLASSNKTDDFQAAGTNPDGSQIIYTLTEEDQEVSKLTITQPFDSTDIIDVVSDGTEVYGIVKRNCNFTLTAKFNVYTADPSLTSLFPTFDSNFIKIYGKLLGLDGVPLGGADADSVEYLEVDFATSGYLTNQSLTITYKFRGIDNTDESTYIKFYGANRFEIGDPLTDSGINPEELFIKNAKWFASYTTETVEIGEVGFARLTNDTVAEGVNGQDVINNLVADISDNSENILLKDNTADRKELIEKDLLNGGATVIYGTDSFEVGAVTGRKPILKQVTPVKASEVVNDTTVPGETVADALIELDATKINGLSVSELQSTQNSVSGVSYANWQIITKTEDGNILALGANEQISINEYNFYKGIYGSDGTEISLTPETIIAEPGDFITINKNSYLASTLLTSGLVFTITAEPAIRNLNSSGAIVSEYPWPFTFVGGDIQSVTELQNGNIFVLNSTGTKYFIVTPTGDPIDSGTLDVPTEDYQFIKSCITLSDGTVMFAKIKDTFGDPLYLDVYIFNTTTKEITSVRNKIAEAYTSSISNTPIVGKTDENEIIVFGIKNDIVQKYYILSELGTVILTGNSKNQEELDDTVFTDTTNGDIIHITLSDGLSYVWGIPESFESIDLDQEYFGVTPNGIVPTNGLNQALTTTSKDFVGAINELDNQLATKADYVVPNGTTALETQGGDTIIYMTGAGTMTYGSSSYTGGFLLQNPSGNVRMTNNQSSIVGPGVFFGGNSPDRNYKTAVGQDGLYIRKDKGTGEYIHIEDYINTKLDTTNAKLDQIYNQLEID